MPATEISGCMRDADIVSLFITALIGDAYLAEKILDALPLGGVPLREVLQHSDLRLEVRGQLLPHVVGRVLPVEEQRCHEI